VLDPAAADAKMDESQKLPAPEADGKAGSAGLEVTA